MKLLDSLRSASKKIEAEVEDSKLFTHSGEIGTFRENIVANFLRPFLPNCYSIGTGQIFDQSDQMSKQIDLVIHDQLFSNVLFKTNEIQLFPFESVYGTVEVKSNLTSEELKTSVENIISVKSLIREDSDVMDLLPHLGGTISKKPGNLITYDKSKANNPLNIVFAYDGLTGNTCVQKLTEILKEFTSKGVDKNFMPDFIFNWKRGYMITKGELKKDGYWFALRNYKGVQKFDGFYMVELGEDTLSFFYLTLNVFLNQIRLKSIGLHEYWNKMYMTKVNKMSNKKNKKSTE